MLVQIVRMDQNTLVVGRFLRRIRRKLKTHENQIEQNPKYRSNRATWDTGNNYMN